MNLNESPFEKIASGKKTVELRLYDEKRRKLDIGDYIIFTNLTNKSQRIAVKVKALYRYASFDELFSEISPERCGNEPGTPAENAAEGMRKYYSKEQEEDCGVLGIKVEMYALDAVLAQQEKDENY